MFGIVYLVSCVWCCVFGMGRLVWGVMHELVGMVNLVWCIWYLVFGICISISICILYGVGLWFASMC